MPLATIAFTVGMPTHSSRLRCSADHTIASAATSGWKIGGTGCDSLPIRDRHQLNCGVFSAGICTIVTCTRLCSFRSSVRIESVKPWIACFAPQYGDCSGMPRYASADPTCTTVPRSRGRILRSADIVPHTVPR